MDGCTYMPTSAILGCPRVISRLADSAPLLLCDGGEMPLRELAATGVWMEGDFTGLGLE